MWSILHIYRKNKGFTLIEVILSLAICSLIIVPILSILDFSIDACTLGDEKDQLILNGRYGIEFIKNEIRTADKIISSDKIKGLKTKFPTNIGFVILIVDEKKPNNEYKYITYHLTKNEIVRVACTIYSDKYPSGGTFEGYNTLCEYVNSIEDSKLNAENSMIYLDLKLKHKKEELNLKSDIYIRCPIDY